MMKEVRGKSKKEELNKMAKRYGFDYTTAFIDYENKVGKHASRQKTFLTGWNICSQAHGEMYEVFADALEKWIKESYKKHELDPENKRSKHLEYIVGALRDEITLSCRQAHIK